MINYSLKAATQHLSRAFLHVQSDRILLTSCIHFQLMWPVSVCIETQQTLNLMMNHIMRKQTTAKNRRWFMSVRLSGELLKIWNEPENIKHLAHWQTEPVFLMAELCSTGGAIEQHSSQQYITLRSCPPGMFLLLSCNYNVHSTNFDHNAMDILSNFT